MMKGATAVCFRVDEDTYRRFKELVLEIHGKLHGTVQFEFNEAMRSHLSKLEAVVDMMRIKSSRVAREPQIDPTTRNPREPTDGGSLLPPIVGRWEDPKD